MGAVLQPGIARRAQWGVTAILKPSRMSTSATSTTGASVAPKPKAYTVPDTPKYHRLGDYARVIAEVGTHDNLSTQAVSALLPVPFLYKLTYVM